MADPIVLEWVSDDAQALASAGNMSAALTNAGRAGQRAGQQVAQGLSKADKAAAAAAASIGESARASEGATKAAERYTAAEKAAAAAVLGQREALKARASDLGLTVGELRKLESAQAEAAAAERESAQAAQAVAKAEREIAEAAREAAAATVSFGEDAQASLTKARKAAESYADASKDIDKGTSSLDQFAESAGDTERVALGVADLFEVLGFAGAAAGARIAADLGGGLEGIIKGGKALRPVLAAGATAASALSLVVAAGATAYSVYANAASEAREETDRLLTSVQLLDRFTDINSESARAAAQDWRAFTDIAQGVQDELDLINGVVDEATLAGERQSKSLTEASRAGILVAAQRVVALEQQIALTYDAIQAGRLNFEETKAATESIAENQAALVDANTALSNRRSELEGAQGAVQTLTEYNLELAKSDETVEERDRKAAEALRIRNAALQAQAAALDGVFAATVKLGEVEQAASLVGADEETLILAARDAQLNAINDTTAAALRAIDERRIAELTLGEDALAVEVRRQEALQQLTVNAEAARVAIVAAADQQINDSHRALMEERAEREAELEEAREQFHERELQRTVLQATAVQSSINSALNAFGALDAQSEQMFNAQKAVAISQIIINQAVAISKALATLGPVAGAAATAGIVAATGFQVAAVGAESYESFHTGGLFGDGLSASATTRRGARDERTVTILGNEEGGILTSQGQRAAGGSDGVNRLNAGMSGMSGGVAVVQLDHRVISMATTRTADRGGRLSRLVQGRDPRHAHHRST